MIALLGTGLLGSGFTRALLRQGEQVQVASRTYTRAQALEAYGAQAFENAADAVRGASRIHLTLSDDASVDDVLERALPGLSSGALIIDHTTTSTAGALARTQRLAELGMRYVHAPVFMGPQNALESTGLMLISGDAAQAESLRPFLEKMTGTLWYVGPRVEEAAAFKLLGNLFLMFLNTGLADLLGLAKATGIAPSDAIKLFQKFNPGASAAVRMQRMIDAKFDDPSWELSMARKDARLMLDEASDAGVELAILPSIAARMDALIAEGHGKSDWSVLGKDFL